MLDRCNRVLTFTGLFALAVCGCDRGSSPEQLGKPAPSFALNDGTRSLSNASLQGHVTVLNFWASWCLPCLEELPSLEALSKSDPQTTVLGVSIDTDPAAYRRYLNTHNIQQTTVLDQEQRISSAFGTFRPPETYILDKHGIVRRKLIGPQNFMSPEIVNFLHALERES